jgi:hypothetical protein
MSTNVFKLVNGERIELTEEENAQRLAAAEAAQAEQDARAWLDGRLSEYGSWSDQLDEMFHSIDAWKERIEAVKTKYPKPT